MEGTNRLAKNQAMAHTRAEFKKEQEKRKKRRSEKCWKRKFCHIFWREKVGESLVNLSSEK